MSERALGYLELVEGCPDGESQERTLKIQKHSILKVGRHAKECNFVLQDPSISSVHCVFWAVVFDEESVPMCYARDLSLNGTFLNELPMKRYSSYHLKEGDRISFCSRKNSELVGQIGSFVFHSILPSQPINEDQLLVSLGFQKNVEDTWTLAPRIIGTGTFGHVLVAYKSTETAMQKPKWSPQNFAVKIIKYKPNKLDKEAKILLRLNHPNIIKVYHTYCDPKDNLYIFQDLIPGGDLFSYLAKGDCLTSISETESLLIVFQILHALNYLHGQGIVHRDLKLDNILLASPEPCSRVVLADFGIAKKLSNTKTTRMHTIVGTPEYCAPEVGFRADRKMYQNFSRAATLEQNGYDEKCDLWSLGVITHIMLTGISPFYGDGTERSIIQNAKQGTLNFHARQWKNIGDNAKDFVRKLLEVDVLKRLDSKQSFQHVWIFKHRSKLEKIYYKKILSVEDPIVVSRSSSADASNVSSDDQKYQTNSLIGIAGTDNNNDITGKSRSTGLNLETKSSFSDQIDWKRKLPISSSTNLASNQKKKYNFKK